MEELNNRLSQIGYRVFSLKNNRLVLVCDNVSEMIQEALLTRRVILNTDANVLTRADIAEIQNSFYRHARSIVLESGYLLDLSKELSVWPVGVGSSGEYLGLYLYPMS